MNSALFEDQLRVTSIPYTCSTMVIFSGVPLRKNSYKTNSGKYYITIKAHPESIPVEPAVGQHWSVKGNRFIEEMDTGDYVMQQHTYESPEEVECRLPETGEQLIRFIAKENDFKGIGESKARALWELLGKDFHSIIKNDTPETRKRLKMVLSEESITALVKGYAKYKNLAHCNWMSEHKIPASVQQRLLKHHGEKSLEAVTKNPYLLIGFGMSFEDIDHMVLSAEHSFKVGKSDDKRLSAALEISIRKEIEKGHTYTTPANLRPSLSKLLKDKELVSKAFKAGHELVQYLLNPDTGNYHPTAQLLMENVVAKRLNGLASQRMLIGTTMDPFHWRRNGSTPFAL